MPRVYKNGQTNVKNLAVNARRILTFDHFDQFVYFRCYGSKIKISMFLTYFSPMLQFYTPWKRQKTFGLVMFSEDREMEY